MPDKRAVGVFCACGLFLVLSEIEPVEPDELPAVKRKLLSEGWKRILHHLPSPDGCAGLGICNPDHLDLEPLGRRDGRPYAG